MSRGSPPGLGVTDDSVELASGEAALAGLAHAHPDNPFASEGYARARAEDGASPIAISFRGGGVTASCLGLLVGGPCVRVLEIPSLPDLPPVDLSAAMSRMVARHRIGLLNVYPYQSRLARIPEWFRADWRRATEEYVWTLAEEPMAHRLHKSAKHGVRHATRGGCQFAVSTSLEDLAGHEEMLRRSRERRVARGERVGAGPRPARMASFLRQGAGELHRVTDAEGRLHSSGLVLRAPEGAYLHSMGSSDWGFEVGAGKLLIFEAARWLWERGVREFNLGAGATPGLCAFKALFGAVARRGEAAIFQTVSPTRRRLLSAADRVLALFGREAA